MTDAEDQRDIVDRGTQGYEQDSYGAVNNALEFIGVAAITMAAAGAVLAIGGAIAHLVMGVI